ncbi:MAG: XRE family transcriptional regulator [Bacteroidales bacterium]|nr:XRE family transcriptional regulator [Bacteroidales bacterium]
MTNDNPMMEVAARLAGLRDALDLTVEEMARECHISPDLLRNYESGTADIPVSFLHGLASTYGVELTALMFGSEPKMSTYSVTRAGKGVKVERTKAYSYQDLAAGFRNRIMAPFMVTVEPKEHQELTLNTHQGQEFNYIVDGELEMTVGGKVMTLRTGDSIMFDAQLPHGFRVMGDKPARFIAIITN